MIPGSVPGLRKGGADFLNHVIKEAVNMAPVAQAVGGAAQKAPGMLRRLWSGWNGAQRAMAQTMARMPAPVRNSHYIYSNVRPGVAAPPVNVPQGAPRVNLRSNAAGRGYEGQTFEMANSHPALMSTSLNPANNTSTLLHEADHGLTGLAQRGDLPWRNSLYLRNRAAGAHAERRVPHVASGKISMRTTHSRP